MEASGSTENFAPLDQPQMLEAKRPSKFKRFRNKFLLVVFVLLIALVYWKYFFTYSEGNRTGLLQKFSYKGTIFKTYEGELILSSIRSQNNVALASELIKCCKDRLYKTNESVEKLIKDLDKAK